VKQLDAIEGTTAMAATAKPRLVFAIVSTGIVLATLDQFIVNIAFPSIQHSLHGSVSTLSWVLNGYSIVFAALLVPAGRLADRSGRKLGFLGGAAIFTGASALCAAASSVEWLVAARVVQGAGAAAMIPSSLGLLLGAYPPEKRAGAVRAWAGVTGASAALGPVVGGLLVEASWRWIFIVNVPIGIGAVIVGWRLLPSPPPERGPMPDLLGAFWLAGAIGALSLALVKGQEWGWGTGRVVGSLFAALLLGIAFVMRSRNHESPVVELSLLRVRRFAAASAATLVYSAGFAAMLFSSIVWTQAEWGWSPLKTGLAFAPGPLMVPLFAFLGGRLIARIGAGATAALGCFAFAAGILSWVERIAVTPHWAAAMLPGALLVGIGVGLTLPTLVAVASTSLPPERFATGSGVVTMARQVGFTLGVSVLVAVLGSPVGAVARLHAFRNGWIVAAAAGLAAIPFALLLVSRRRPRHVTAPEELVTELAA
jgi:EmrB/QacA subfamily drug resistance transporter